jgi:hypothetical protein
VTRNYGKSVIQLKDAFQCNKTNTHPTYNSLRPTNLLPSYALDLLIKFAGPVSDSGKYILLFVLTTARFFYAFLFNSRPSTSDMSQQPEKLRSKKISNARVISDNRPQFRSNTSKAYLAKKIINCSLTSGYYLQGDGRTERHNQTLQKKLPILFSGKNTVRAKQSE